MGTRVRWGAMGVAWLCVATPAWAWWANGHLVMTPAAGRLLPGDMPAFFRQSIDAVAQYAVDPDMLRLKATPHLRNQQHPEHFIDVELLDGRALPPTRYAYLKMCYAMKRDPSKVGTLPYAVAEWTERLTIAFAEHRRWPDDATVQWKCRFYAGILAHYAQDLHQPLHLTIHYDGRARPDGSSPGTGIHAKVDTLIARLGLRPDAVAGAAAKPRVFQSLFPAIVAQIGRVRERIDDVYAMASEFPAVNGPVKTTARVRQFALDRAADGATFTASLWLTAWRRSATIRLPAWLERPGKDKAR